MDYILEDMSMHIKQKELKWDKRIVNDPQIMEDSFVRSIVGHEKIQFMTDFTHDFELEKSIEHDNPKNPS